MCVFKMAVGVGKRDEEGSWAYETYAIKHNKMFNQQLHSIQLPLTLLII